jgi:Histidine kinase-like ATPase domain
LSSDLESVGAVRHRLHALLVDLPHAPRDDVLLVASEVITNAVVYGAGPVDIRVSVRGPMLRVEVADRGEAVPLRAQDRGDEAEHGRGLFIVDVLTNRWGVFRNHLGPGKTVWFEMGQALRAAVPRDSLRTDRWPYLTAAATATHCYVVDWDRLSEIPGW